MDLKNKWLGNDFTFKDFWFRGIGVVWIYSSFFDQWDINNLYTVNDLFVNDFLVNFITWVNPQFNEINYYFLILSFMHYFFVWTYYDYFRFSTFISLYMFLSFLLIWLSADVEELFVTFNSINVIIIEIMNVDLLNVNLFHMFLIAILFDFTLWLAFFVKTFLIHAIFLSQSHKIILYYVINVIMLLSFFISTTIWVHFLLLSFLRVLLSSYELRSLGGLIFTLNDIFLLYEKKVKSMEDNYYKINHKKYKKTNLKYYRKFEKLLSDYLDIRSRDLFVYMLLRCIYPFLHSQFLKGI